MISYLNSQKYFDSNALEKCGALFDVLVLVPSYQGPKPLSRFCLDRLARCGAEIIACYECSDPALHRCIVAERAVHLLKKRPSFKFVLWVDDDMSYTPADVAMLREFARGTGVAISGYYCKRGNSMSLTLKHHDGPVLTVEHSKAMLLHECEIERHPTVELLPVTAGMGFMILPRETFDRHCESVPQCSRTLQDECGRSMPAICSSGPIRYDDGTFGWCSEDEVYCRSLWHHGRGVYAAPIAVGHVSSVPLLPSPESVFLG